MFCMYITNWMLDHYIKAHMEQIYLETTCDHLSYDSYVSKMQQLGQ